MRALIDASIVRTLLIGSLLVAGCSLSKAETVSITVTDARPVAKAAEELEAIYGIPITYEDLPYAHPGQLRDVTAAVRRDGSAGAPRILVPRGGTLKFSYAALTRGTPEQEITFSALRSANSMLGQYASDAGSFQVVQATNRVHIVPVSVLDANGQLETVRSPLDLPVSIASRPRNGVELITSLVEQLSTSMHGTVVVGTVTSSELATHRTLLGASGESARSVLDRLFDETGSAMSWQLFYDPGLHWYVLNIHGVRRPKAN